jgi:hypothetical protein
MMVSFSMEVGGRSWLGRGMDILLLYTSFGAADHRLNPSLLEHEFHLPLLSSQTLLSSMV